MGRKIPARKHRGVLDPLKQIKEREGKLQHIINAPPKTLDQPVPKSLLEITRLKEIGRKAQFKSTGKKKKRAPDGAFIRKTSSEDKGRKSNTKSKISKEKNSSEDWDQNRSTQLQEKYFDDSDDETIDRTHGKVNWKDGTEKRKEKTRPGAVQKKKVDRRIEKRKKMLEKKREKMEEKSLSVKKDVVAFGEVVHEPPSMRIKPKYASSNERQMGMKDLHLKRLLNGGTAPVAIVSGATVAKPQVRLRDLPARERDEMERKQQDAIAAYKLLKAKKYSAKKER